MIAAPFVMLWMLVAGGRAMDEPARRRWPDSSRSPLADAATLRLIARRTWRFFETFVTAEDNMLAA